MKVSLAKLYIAVLTFVFLISCSQKNELNERINIEKQTETSKKDTIVRKFEIPKFKGINKNGLVKYSKFDTIFTKLKNFPTDVAVYFKTDSLNNLPGPIFVGKYPFSKEIDINKKDTSYKHDFIYEFRGDRYVDIHNDSLSMDGFQLIVDYETNIVLSFPRTLWGNTFYPVYVVNETQSTKIFTGKDSHLFSLQEARDSNYRWYPIERRPIEMCGHGYWGLRIHPGEFALFILQKYTGNFKTWLRVRLKNGTNIYVSKPFIGTINPSQFYIPHYARNYYYLKENPAKAIMSRFYGSIPKELD